MADDDFNWDDLPKEQRDRITEAFRSGQKRKNLALDPVDSNLDTRLRLIMREEMKGIIDECQDAMERVLVKRMSRIGLKIDEAHADETYQNITAVFETHKNVRGFLKHMITAVAIGIGGSILFAIVAFLNSIGIKIPQPPGGGH